ncbi:MAG: polyprenyl synthetase family protein [Gemmatimonadetes bacterium]|nr:polyprenyl synthetase family protein [Gemmatimonadota bacterium]
MTTDSAAGPAHSLGDYLDRRREGVEAALHRAVDDLALVLPDPWLQPARAGVLSGGKRLRPCLLIAASEAFGLDPSDSLYDLAASVELIHAYSLMHDDLPCMDDAPLRRGRPTPHTEFGVEATAVAAAALIPWAASRAALSCHALGVSPDRRATVVGRLLDAAGAAGMVGGQALDLMGEGRALGREELSRLHRLKTGALLTAPVVMGAMVAGASREQWEAVGEYGINLGLAFQVMDDVLDATASAEVLGKRPSDADLEKSTYVLLLGVEGARRSAEALVRRADAALDRTGVEGVRLRQLSRFVLERTN